MLIYIRYFCCIDIIRKENSSVDCIQSQFSIYTWNLDFGNEKNKCRKIFSFAVLIRAKATLNYGSDRAGLGKELTFPYVQNIFLCGWLDHFVKRWQADEKNNSLNWFSSSCKGTRQQFLWSRKLRRPVFEQYTSTDLSSTEEISRWHNLSQIFEG